jgi:hypothetical protein
MNILAAPDFALLGGFLIAVGSAAGRRRVRAIVPIGLSIALMTATLSLFPSVNANSEAVGKSTPYVCSFSGVMKLDGQYGWGLVSKVFTDTRSFDTVNSLWQAWLAKHLPTTSPSGYAADIDWSLGPKSGGCWSKDSVPQAEQERAGRLTGSAAVDWPPPGPTVHFIQSKLVAKYWFCRGALGPSASNKSNQAYITPVFEIPFVVSEAEVTAKFKAYFAAQHPEPDRVHGQECYGSPMMDEIERLRAEKMSTIVPPSRIDFNYNEFKLGGPNAK